MEGANCKGTRREEVGVLEKCEGGWGEACRATRSMKNDYNMVGGEEGSFFKLGRARDHFFLTAVLAFFPPLALSSPLKISRVSARVRRGEGTAGCTFLFFWMSAASLGVALKKLSSRLWGLDARRARSFSAPFLMRSSLLIVREKGSGVQTARIEERKRPT